MTPPEAPVPDRATWARPAVVRTVRCAPDHYTIGRPLHPGTGRSGAQAPILYIALHNTETPDAGDAPSLAWLTRTSDPPSSAHRLISRSGMRWDLCDYLDTCWHIGEASYAGWDGWHLNLRSVGIELENGSDSRTGHREPYSPALLNTLAHQVASLLFSYGRTWAQAVIRHGDVALPPGRRVDPSYLDLAGVQAATAVWLTRFATLAPADHAAYIY